MVKVKKIPQRTCLGCQTVRPKKELIRIIRTPAGEVAVDSSGKKSGRGGYICPSLDCLAGCLKGAVLERALATPITESTKERLQTELSQLIK